MKLLPLVDPIRPTIYMKLSHTFTRERVESDVRGHYRKALVRNPRNRIITHQITVLDTLDSTIQRSQNDVGIDLTQVFHTRPAG